MGARSSTQPQKNAMLRDVDVRQRRNERRALKTG